MNPGIALEFLRDTRKRGERAKLAVENSNRMFGLAVSIARGERGMPASELARKLKVSPQLYSLMETGARRWSLALASRAARILAGTVFIDPWPDRSTGAWRRKYLRHRPQKR